MAIGPVMLSTYRRATYRVARSSCALPASSRTIRLEGGVVRPIDLSKPARPMAANRTLS